MTSARDAVKVSPLHFGNNTPKAVDGKPAHWKNAKGSAFQNPWPSFEPRTPYDVPKLWWRILGTFPKVPDDIDTQIPCVRPTWGKTASPNEPSKADKIKATWLGHACFLVELPARSTSTTPIPSRGARILFDPAFSDRCSPSQRFGPRRYTKAPCDIADVPEVDAIVISHNHYDHMDTETIRAFSKRQHPPHLFAPLGNTDVLRSAGVSKDKIHCLDWWEGRHVEVDVGGSSSRSTTTELTTSETKGEPTTVAFNLTCTPCQHGATRSLFDVGKTLWSSWVVEEILPPSLDRDVEGPKREGVKVYFAGDTGYRNVPEGANEDEVPCCPAFKEIGERFGGFDFAMIPIGAYNPRDFMSPIHCAPQDSVRIFQDVRAKKALGMHWGTWMLTNEDVMEPPRRLAEECKKAGIPKEDFDVCKLGETLFF